VGQNSVTTPILAPLLSSRQTAWSKTIIGTTSRFDRQTISDYNLSRRRK
jgi:hypothetical protein